MIKEKAYAKLNLSLSVLGKRNDGFHELESIMVPLNLYDTLYFEENNSDEMILLDNKIEDNSILKAAKLFQEKYKTKGATIRLKKRIPLEAGLAGGSADSSATLRGLNRLFKLNRPLKELEELALKLGSDNVFCLYNHAAICRGRGELLEFIDFDFKFKVMLIKPNFGLSTKEVFSNVKLKEKNKIDELLIGLKNNDKDVLDKNVYNDLFESAVITKPELNFVVEKIKENDVLVHMSGSGTTIFLLRWNKLVKKELKSLQNVEKCAKYTIKKRYHDCLK